MPFYQKESQIPGWWSGVRGEVHGWTGPGWYEGGIHDLRSVAAPAPETATTPQELEQTMDWSNVSGKSGMSGAAGTPLTYQALKDAGMWNLADPNSVTWQWIDEHYGSGAGLQGVSREEMLARALFDLQVPESEYATAFQGLDPQFMQSLQGEVQRINQVHEEADKDQDWTDKYLEPLVMPAVMALGGHIIGAAGAAGGAAATSGSVSGAELASLIESGTLGLEGAALEAAGLSGGSALYSTATGALQGLGSATGVTPFDPTIDYTAQAIDSALSQPIGGSTPTSLADALANQPLTGPETGAVMEPGLQPSGAVTLPVGTGGQPNVTAVATGAGDFIPTTLADALASGGGTAPPSVTPEESLVGPPTGTVEAPGLQPSGATTGPAAGSGVPDVTGVATGAGPFLDAASNVIAGGAAAAGAGGASAGGTGAATTTAGAGTALSRILNGTATDADWLSVLGTVGSTALGIYGADQQADAFRDAAEREDARIREMMGFGAPYRGRLAELSADPSSFLSSPEVTTPVQQGTDALARALSVRGNPAGSGTALHELQNYATNQLYGRLGQEKDRLAGFGGLTAYNQAAAGGPNLGLTTAGINAQGNVLNAAGYGLGQITNPPTSLEQLLRQMRGTGGASLP